MFVKGLAKKLSKKRNEECYNLLAQKHFVNRGDAQVWSYNYIYNILKNQIFTKRPLIRLEMVQKASIWKLF